jgi:hypothetical protein
MLQLLRESLSLPNLQCNKYLEKYFTFLPVCHPAGPKEKPVHSTDTYVYALENYAFNPISAYTFKQAIHAPSTKNFRPLASPPQFQPLPTILNRLGCLNPSGMSHFSSFQSISPLTDQFTILISHSSTVFVKYSPNLKAVALKLLIQGKSLQTVNKLIETNISTKSLRQWKDLWT